MVVVVVRGDREDGCGERVMMSVVMMVEVMVAVVCTQVIMVMVVVGLHFVKLIMTNSDGGDDCVRGDCVV